MIPSTWTRRRFLQAGLLGLGGLPLSDFLSIHHALGAPAGKTLNDRRALFINLGGGPSHLDTFDPKPNAPAEVRGEFGVSRTKSGDLICDLLPQLAACSDRYTLIRSVTHNLGDHAQAGRFLTTGNRPIPSLLFPGYGSVVSKEKPAAPNVPPYVAIPDGGTAGYLGVAYSPYAVGGDANAKDFSVRSLALPQGLTADRLDRRRALTKAIDNLGGASDQRPELLDGMDQFQQQAYAIISSRATREAFDIHRENDRVRDGYGRNTFGQSLLLARRLLEAGVRCVTVNFPVTWDTHEKNFAALKERHLPWLDRGLSVLLDDLGQRGLLDSTVVFTTGEFGRTPKINANAGRDHWPSAFTVLFAGAGVAPGRVIGKTDPEAGQPTERPVSPEDVAATFYRLLGIDASKEYQTPSGRPIQIVREGTVIGEVLG